MERAQRIVIAEDDTIARTGLKLMLEEAGYRVVGEGSTAEQAVALALDCRPDLCIIDVNLAQGSSGIAAAETIIQRLGLPIVLISGITDEPKVVPFLTKPFTPAQLLAAMKKALPPV
jgi:response regulator NasT